MHNAGLRNCCWLSLTARRGQLIKLLGTFGMTPADRSKISIDSTVLDPASRISHQAKAGYALLPAMSDKPSEAVQ